jgi:hypothetical protein
MTAVRLAGYAVAGTAAGLTVGLAEAVPALRFALALVALAAGVVAVLATRDRSAPR